MSDQNWPRRKKSDLMVGRINMPEYNLPRYRKLERVKADPPAAGHGKETIIPIQRKVGPVAPAAPPADMWPRRKKSDLLIYQQTRNI